MQYGKTEKKIENITLSDRKSENTLKKGKNKSLFKLIVAVSFFLFLFISFISLNVFGSDNYYTVKRDESLDKVAKKFNVPKKVLLNLNNLSSEEEFEEGLRIQIRNTYDIYTVKPGDTLKDIAKANGIKRYDLVKHNKFVQSKKLEPGEKIHIPRVLSDITIKSSRKTGLKPLKVEFSVTTNTREKVKYYKWDLGDGTISTKKAPVHIYKNKGTYKVKLDIIDENNNEISSDVIDLDVRALANIQFTNTTYFEVNVGDLISLDAKAIDNIGNPVDFNYKTEISGSPRVLRQIENSDKFKAVKSGYANIRIESEGYVHNGYYFISPTKAKQSSHPNVNWYKTQYNTGVNGNCGPACTAMSIIWATGKDVEVSAIRDIIGLPIENGAIGFNHIMTALNRYSIKYNFKRIYGHQDIMNIIDKDNIAIIVFTMDMLEKVKGDAAFDLVGRYYEESGGHYIVVKGYSQDKKYFIVNDPMPADWWLNKARYSDGVSMIGRNRYYPVTEIMKALRTMNVLEIFK